MSAHPALTPDECRVIGVLIEKAQTTPGQYPLTLNALVSGCNQKSNRAPVMQINEDRAIAALDSLRAKGLVREVMMSGSRVNKFRHVVREGLEVSTSELVVLAELLLRGPQSVGEIRNRASRMHPLESLESTQAVLDHLMSREPPMIAKHPPPPGSRADRFSQLLCPDLHPISMEAVAGGSGAPAHGPTGGTGSQQVGTGELERRIAQLEAEVEALKDTVERLIGS